MKMLRNFVDEEVKKEDEEMLENREIEEVKKEDPDVDSIWMTFFSRRWRTAGREYATLYGCSSTNKDQYQCHNYSFQWVYYTLKILA